MLEGVVMVASIDEIMQVVRSNPFIDGIGYFVEVTTADPVPGASVEEITERMQHDFCEHSKATLEGEHVLGLDFHEHIFTGGDDGDYYLSSMEGLLKIVEMEFGISHLCIEFQFDFTGALKARTEVDDLLQP